jgi:hypothetical protein
MTTADHDTLHHQHQQSTVCQTAYSLVPHLDALQRVYLLTSLFTYFNGTELLETSLIPGGPS